MKRTFLVFPLIGLALVAGLLMTSRALSGGVQADQRAVSAANALVESGHTAEAVQIYEQLVTQGARDGALFYNLGNAYFQQGNLGRAIVSYEQAAQLTPRDPDVRQNLAQARSQAKIAAPQPAGVLGRLAQASSQWLTVNELALLALGAWFLLGFLVLAYRHFQPGRRPAALRYAAGVALLCVVITGVSLAGRLTSGAQMHTSQPALAQPVGDQA